jgi:dihydroorotase (multifunctional complex type)
MQEPFDLMVRGGTVVGAGLTRRLDIGIREGRFAVVAEPDAPDTPATAVLDATGLHVLPGVIDGHVHFREPGFEHKEDWATGSRAAVAGGVTTAIDMPNTQPPTRTAPDARAKAELAQAKAVCDFGLYGLIDAPVDLGRLKELIESGYVVGLKVFLGPTTGGLTAPADGDLVQALGLAESAEMRVGFHAEEASVLMQVANLLGAPSEAIGHLDSRPESAEVIAIDHVGRLLQQSGARGHIHHLSSVTGLEAIERWRAVGIDMTCELSAHHVFLGRDDYARLGPQIKSNPPIRGEPHASALLAALADGRIDAIVSDHAPHAPTEKLGWDVNEVHAGINGIETTVPLFLNAVTDGRLSLERLADATSAAAARIWGLAGKGRLEEGADADLTLVDLQREHTIHAADLHGKHQISPFDGRAVTGWPVATVVRGQVVMRDGDIAAQPGYGRLITRG